MKLRKAMELIEKYSDCPNCGNDMIGKGAGAMVIDHATFMRSCSCGFKVIVDMEGEADE